MNINKEKLDKSCNILGAEPDDIMLMEDEEFIKAYHSKNILDEFFEEDYYPSVYEIYKNSGKTLNYLNKILVLIDNIDNLSEEDISSLKYIFTTLKERFTLLKQSIQTDICLLGNAISAEKDFYKKSEIQKEDLKLEIEADDRCNALINSINNAINIINDYQKGKGR